MNFTTNLSAFGESICTNGCLSPDKCKEICLSSGIEYHYEFVWFFVIAFIFRECAMYVYMFRDIDAGLKEKLSRGLKIAGYLLNLAGIFWFLLFVI